KRLKNGLLAIFVPGFPAKNRGLLCKHLTRPPWRSLFYIKNGKMFFHGLPRIQTKVPQNFQKRN
ncbi:MAG: hypothetical protein II077_03470, partial [Treponema sp.]|nr:hypothetical protein [Treponema sp.]